MNFIAYSFTVSHLLYIIFIVLLFYVIDLIIYHNQIDAIVCLIRNSSQNYINGSKFVYKLWLELFSILIYKYFLNV